MFCRSCYMILCFCIQIDKLPLRSEDLRGSSLLDHTVDAKVTQETNLTFDILIRGRFKNQYRTSLHKQLLAIRRIAL